MHSAASPKRERTLCQRAVDKWRHPNQVKHATGFVAGQSGILRTYPYSVTGRCNPGKGQGNVSYMNIDFPFRFDRRGSTATANDEKHVRDMIEELLFTNPGERVNRPDFGSGVMQLVFAPNSPELAAALQFTVQAALQRWLGDLIEVQKLEVTSEDSTLNITVQYAVRRTNQVTTARFTQTV
jgi:uncharacterized protein